MNKFLKNAFFVAFAAFALVLVGCIEDDDEDMIEAPDAGFTASQDGATVTFTNTSTGEDLEYSWDFGDNTSSALENPVKTYESADEYTVVLTVTNDGGEDTASETFTITASQADEVAPVITLVGEASVTLLVGDTYEDAGATASDNVDMDITANIVVTGSVDTSTAGDYVLTYDVSDAAGNAATSVTRNVTVLENVRVEDGLLTNGDFQDGDASWYVNYGDPEVPEIQISEGNRFFFANVSGSNSEQPFLVNLSQDVALTVDEYYILSFDASTGAGTSRPIIAGIGLNQDPFSNDTETVTLTDQTQRFEVKVQAAGFGGETNSRVLFDLNGADGVVVLDNVKLEVDPEGGGDAAVPTDAPATPPTREAADVISIYGEAYGAALGLSNVDYDGTDWAEESIAGNNVIKMTFPNGFIGSVLANPVDASGMTNFHMDFWIADEFAAGQVVLPKWSNHANGAGETSNFEYTKAIGGDEARTWVSIDVPISSFSAGDNSQRAQLKEFLIGVANTIDVMYVDNIYFYKSENSGGGGGTAGDNICVNGDFETGDKTGWTEFDEPGEFVVSNAEANGGTFSGLLRADVDNLGNGGASFKVVKQANLGAGTLTPGATVQVSFDMKGSITGAGGVVFVQLFSELAEGGVSKDEFIVQPPVFPTDTWENISLTTTLGNDVAGGVTIQFKVDCGANAGCAVEAYFDNVSLQVVE